MRRLTILFAVPLAMLMLLAGCASTLRSEVTAYHQWPKDAAGSTFSFAHTQLEEQSLQRQAFEDQVRTELLKLGLQEVRPGESAQLAVRIGYSNEGRDVRVVETMLIDPWYGSPWYGSGFYNPYWGWNSFGYPYYGRMWPSMPVAREVERRYTLFRRELNIKISHADTGRPLFDVTVKSEGREGNLAKVMPYLVEAAFRDFPGQSGEPRMVEVKIKH